MGTELEHRAKADHNHRFLEAIDVDRFPDWAATVAFYTAVHLVEMYFAAQRSVHSESHRTRNQRLKDHHRDLWKEFRPLYNLSLVARYTGQAISPTTVREQILAGRLKRLETLIAAA